MMMIQDKIDLTRVRRSAASACSLLKALGHEHRLVLLCQLAEGERCVGELEEMLDIRQPSLSQQLGVLRNEGLVTTRREGTRIYYTLASREAVAVMSTLYQQFCLPRAGR